MPNRMLRDWTRSDRVNGLSVNAERFFVRLIMKVDDYGCYYADARILKADLFPLLDSVRSADIPRWMAECQKAGLLVTYNQEGKKYLQINDFRQRLDKARSKFPTPTNGLTEPVNDFPESVNDFPAEVEVEVEKEKREAFRPPATEDVISFMSEKLDDFTAMGEAAKFVAYYTSNGWKVGRNKMKDWRSAATGWMSRMKDYRRPEPKKEERIVSSPKLPDINEQLRKMQC